jgi:hypothetical protein
MKRTLNMQQVQAELVEAFSWGDEAQARLLVSQLAAQPRKARALLETMLQDSDAQVRQAAAFGLGELGGAASAKRLEQQLSLEEARGDYDGESVVEVITEALGRIEEAGTRATLLRRLERLAAGNPAPGDVGTVARALWRRRHPDMIPAVQRALGQLTQHAWSILHGLLLLLEKSPEELAAWAADPTVSAVNKMEAIYILEEEVPEALVPTLPAFISAAHGLAGVVAADQRSEAAHYCDRLFRLLLQHRERLLPSFSQETLAELYDLTRTLVAAPVPIPFLEAAVMLQFIGQPEDAALLEAHRPAEPVLAKVFDDAAQALRSRPPPS